MRNYAVWSHTILLTELPPCSGPSTRYPHQHRPPHQRPHRRQHQRPQQLQVRLQHRRAFLLFLQARVLWCATVSAARIILRTTMVLTVVKSTCFWIVLLKSRISEQKCSRIRWWSVVKVTAVHWAPIVQWSVLPSPGQRTVRTTRRVGIFVLWCPHLHQHRHQHRVPRCLSRLRAQNCQSDDYRVYSPYYPSNYNSSDACSIEAQVDVTLHVKALRLKIRRRVAIQPSQPIPDLQLRREPSILAGYGTCFQKFRIRGSLIDKTRASPCL